MNLGPTIAALRHVGTYAAGVTTGLLLLGVKQETAQQVVDAFIQMSNSLADVLQAVGIIAPIIIAWYSAYKATRGSRLKSIENMSANDANQAVASLPTEAKASIRLATIPDHKLVEAVAALPDVSKIEVKPTVLDAVAMAAADPAQPKIVLQK